MCIFFIVHIKFISVAAGRALDTPDTKELCKQQSTALCIIEPCQGNLTTFQQNPVKKGQKTYSCTIKGKGKDKAVPLQAWMAQRVPGS